MKKIILLSLSLWLFACGQSASTSAQNAVEDAKDAVSCQSVSPMLTESRLWDIYTSGKGGRHEVSAVADFESALAADSELSDELKQVLTDFHSLLVDRIPREQRLKTWDEKRAYWSSLEIGDRTSPAKIMYQEELKKLFLRLNGTRIDFQSQSVRASACSTPAAVPRTTAEWLKPFSDQGFNRVQAGSRWAFTNSFQICSPLRQPAVDKNVPDVQGIIEVGTHSDGVGTLRKIGDLAALMRTHPYFTKDTGVGSGCFNTYQKPMIYDYGGKPNTDNGTFNYFLNAGDGTSVLGIDCSGLVFSAMATAGLKLSSDKILKASYVHGISSYMYVAPADNGLDCIDKIKVGPGEDLKAGDIVAVLGHVFFIHSVGQDPWGLAQTRSAADCSTLDYQKFNFTIMQSSPWKKGLGIHIAKVADYLPSSDKVRNGLLKYAKAVCLNKYSGNVTKPNYSDVAIDRHKGSEVCLASRITMESERCIASCQDLYRR